MPCTDCLSISLSLYHLSIYLLIIHFRKNYWFSQLSLSLFQNHRFLFLMLNLPYLALHKNYRCLSILLNHSYSPKSLKIIQFCFLPERHNLLYIYISLYLAISFLFRSFQSPFVFLVETPTSIALLKKIVLSFSSLISQLCQSSRNTFLSAVGFSDAITFLVEYFIYFSFSTFRF